MKRTGKVFIAIIVSALTVILLSGCQSTQKKYDLLIGWVSQDQLFEAIPQYKKDFDAYNPDTKAINTIRMFTHDVDVLVFFGRWCSDCARELPSLLKTLNVAGNEHFKVRLLSLEKNKADAENLVDRYSLEYIPTIVLSINGREFGRIIEKAELSVEEDMALMLQELKGR